MGVVAMVEVIFLALALVLTARMTAAAVISLLFFSGCLSTVYPRDGIGSCVLNNVGTPHRRHRAVRGQGSNSHSRQ